MTWPESFDGLEKSKDKGEKVTGNHKGIDLKVGGTSNVTTVSNDLVKRSILLLYLVPIQQ
jgi:hypothetical protein